MVWPIVAEEGRRRRDRAWSRRWQWWRRKNPAERPLPCLTWDPSASTRWRTSSRSNGRARTKKWWLGGAGTRRGGRSSTREKEGRGRRRGQGRVEEAGHSAPSKPARRPRPGHAAPARRAWPPRRQDARRGARARALAGAGTSGRERGEGEDDRWGPREEEDTDLRAPQRNI